MEFIPKVNLLLYGSFSELEYPQKNSEFLQNHKLTKKSRRALIQIYILQVTNLRHTVSVETGFTIKNQENVDK